MRCSPVLPRSFYARSAAEVARALLGKILVHKDAPGGEALAGRIVETEAYLGLNDRASHAWRGVTPRTKVLFGPPGHAYVYLIYGIYECMNIVAEAEGAAGCVLIRALEPLSGIETMRQRRGSPKRVEDIANGPGKLTRAMGITRRHNGRDLTLGSLTVREPESAAERDPDHFQIGVSPRIGITHSTEWPLRFFILGNAAVSR